MFQNHKFEEIGSQKNIDIEIGQSPYSEVCEDPLVSTISTCSITDPVTKQNDALAVAYEEINYNGGSSEEDGTEKKNAIQKKNKKIAIS